MIKYDASDIIKRAEQIADLENSDFITDYEKLALLNENWVMLYDKLISANDKTFVKTISVRDGDLVPYDFYKVSTIYYRNDPLNSPRYIIKNDTFKFEEGWNTKEMELEYYPNPKTIFLKEKTVDSPYPEDIITAYKTLYLRQSDTNNEIGDINDTSVSILIENDYIDQALFKNAALLEKTDGYYWFKYEDNVLGKLDNLIPWIIDNYLYVYDPETKTIEDEEGNIYEKDVDIDTTNILYIYSDDILKNIYRFGSDFYIFNDNSKVNINARKLAGRWSNGHPYFINSTKKLIRCDEDRLYVIKTNYIPITIISEKYILTKKPMSSLFYLEGLMEDTLLEVPNSLFYSVLSYLLALSFLTKQGSENIAAVQANYESYYEQFFNSVQPMQNYRIRNSYR